MSLAEELSDAMRIPIYPGQRVVIRTLDGEVVGEGYVEGLDPERGLVLVRDQESGSDVQHAVDVDRYVLWVQPPADFEPLTSPPENLFVRASKPGPYGRQWATRVGS